jgi:hypothetical protein
MSFTPDADARAYDPEISNSILEGISLGEGKAMEDFEVVVNRLENLGTKQTENVKLN